ncbi:uncharacterized protein F5891DRAFT_985855 [Suillus fuscotomentosus]|uniref:Uncharacterized protein n=1 Tax=Suillus fuscotomentosus TaxID=1912939 RepID=A0AAD4DT75_9AGAM|nr:uncharacterized protein F5891DRAFT_985855 [Suillus fuscotomentosus]KAG1893510.1 hypothetical protein F5891DRAFT_985855 [Suillus fuscotomentosus]
MDQNIQLQNDRFSIQGQNDQSVQSLLMFPDLTTIPGPLIITDSAIAIWNATTQIAQYRVAHHRTALPHEPINTTEEQKCWLNLILLRREHKLEEYMRCLDSAWRELNEMRKLLDIRRNQ